MIITDADIEGLKSEKKSNHSSPREFDEKIKKEQEENEK